MLDSAGRPSGGIMGHSPLWKVYSHKKEYIASCRYAEDAAVLVGCYPKGARVKFRHTLTVWIEGKELFSASISADRAAAVMRTRVDNFWKKYR